MSDPQPSPLGRLLMIVIVLVIVVLGAAWLMNRHDGRTPEEKLGDAIVSTDVTISHTADKMTDGTAASNTSSALSKTGEALSKAGEATSSAVSKAGEKASVAISETSADIKAAVDKQKQQNARDQKNGVDKNN